jgi:RHS repeat-associated protein
LGNIRETYVHPEAGYKKCIQRMQYYPSGLPWAEATNSSEQPYKYNSKEFVEMHGYDVYEYGARGYYATIGRFTSIDPLCEQTPWQSPYVYANNNWVNNIDWMGMSADGFHVPTLNWVAVDEQGTVLGYDMQHPDQYVYLIDDKNWDGSYDGLSDYSAVGWQIPFVTYSIGRQCPFIALDLSGIYTHVPGGTFSFVPCAIESSGEIISDILTIFDLSFNSPLTAVNLVFFPSNLTLNVNTCSPF